RPGRGGPLGDDDLHLTAHVRGTLELIFGGHIERQPEALPRHDQSRSEDLRYAVEVAEHEHVTQPEHQTYFGGQYLGVDAGAPHFPGAVGDLEERVSRFYLDWDERRGERHAARQNERHPQGLRSSWFHVSSSRFTSWRMSAAGSPNGTSKRSTPFLSIR